MDPKPDLATADGAVIIPKVAMALVGPLAPGQYAQADPQANAGSAVGEITNMSGTVQVTRKNGVAETIEVGAKIFEGDVIATKGTATAALVFIDGTSMSIAESARLVIDELVYNPGSSKASFNLVQGAFAFVSGSIAKEGSDTMTVQTPVATIGIRGTKATIKADQSSNTVKVVLLPEADG